jgi:hypothetical protein
MLSSQLKGVPQAEQDKIFDMIEKNPDLFTKIGTEVQEKMKKENKDQMAAAMEVMQKYKSELQGLMK